jgi:hypothetical protein
VLGVDELPKYCQFVVLVEDPEMTCQGIFGTSGQTKQGLGHQ